MQHLRALHLQKFFYSLDDWIDELKKHLLVRQGFDEKKKYLGKKKKKKIILHISNKKRAEDIFK